MRYPSIDILRTLAIVVMVIVHFPENLSGMTLPINGLGAPIFAFVSGISYRLWANGRMAKGTSEEEISKISIRRGLFVFGVGFLFNIFVWLPEDTFNWDVLTFIGFSLLMLNLFRKAPLTIVVFVAIIIMLISPLLRDLADWQSYWIDRAFDPDMSLRDIIVGFLATGYFPIFPWLVFPLTGYVTASLLFGTSPESGESSLSPERIMLVGWALMATSLAGYISGPFLPDVIYQKVLGDWSMFPPTMVYVFGVAGMALLLFGILHRWVDLNPNQSRYQGFLNITKSFSRHSFSIYVIHHIVHLWPMWIYAVYTGKEPTFYWRKALSFEVSLSLSFLFLAICYFLLRWQGPKKNRGIESWMRWLCD